MSLSRIGKKLSEETKLKMSLSRIGMKFSDEHRQNMAKVRKGKKPEKATEYSIIAKREKFIQEIRNNKKLFDDIYKTFPNKFSKKIYNEYFINCSKKWTQIRAIVNGKLWKEAYEIVKKENIW